MRTQRILPVALALALAVTLGACSSEPDGTDTSEVEVTGPDATSEADETYETDDADDAEGRDVVTSAVAAIAAAEAEVGGTAFEIESEGGGWEVDVAIDDSRYVEVKVDRDGTVVGVDDEDDLDGTDREGLATASITLGDAIEIAFAEVGGILDDVELDREGGALVWEVNLDDGPRIEHEVYVDVATGDVVKVDTDD